MAVRGIDDAGVAEVDAVPDGHVADLRFRADENRRDQTFCGGFEGALQ